MKKLLLIAAIGAAGLMSAKSITEKKVIKKVETTEKKVRSKVSNKAKKAVFYNWIQVTSPCGAVYYLEASDYGSIEAFADDVVYFNAQKCGTSYPLA